MKKIYLTLSISIVFSLVQRLNAQSELWGLNPAGANGYGTIYGLPTGSTGIATQFDLVGNPGSGPQYAKLIEAPTTGKLYGMTNAGGANNAGVLFEYDTLTNAYARKVDFGGTNGINPKGSLVRAANGKLYGMTQFGGASSLGVIFEYDIALNSFVKRVDFTGTAGAAPGAQPYGTLLDPNPGSGKLYGLTRFGGTSNVGVLFEYDYNTNVYTVKVNFTGTTGLAQGASPFGQLIRAASSSTSTLYGLASGGGTNNAGVLFEYDYVTDVYTKKVDLSAAIGNNPQGSLLLASNGKLYGMTANGGAGVPTAAGVIFEYNIGTSTYTKLSDLVGSSVNGANPFGELMQATNGKLYGMTRLGGASNVGVIFEFDITGSVYIKKIDLVTSASIGSAPFGSLMQVSTGKLYGMTSLGGSLGAGVIFNYNMNTNTYTKRIDFNFSNGGNANGNLMRAGNGKLYGLANIGGTSNLGVIFEYDKTSGIYTKKIDFTGGTGAAIGSLPFGSLIEATNSKLYGLTSAGGSGALGTLFEYDYTTNAYTKRVDFTGNAGANPGGVPYGSLVQFSGNGKLYGMTKQGGSSGQGVIFEYDPAINVYTKKIDMLAVNGFSAFGSLVESSGKLYGMTQLGGANSLGVIFEYDPVTNIYTKKIDFTGTTGAAPGSLAFGSMVPTATAGVLYGMTRTGGANDLGVIFEYSVTTNTYIKKFDMVAGTGSLPQGSLVRAANGNLYGVTNAGGANSTGALFEFDITSATYTKKIDFSSSTGNLPTYTQLLEVCTKPTTPGSITSSTNAICLGNSSSQNYSISAVANATAYAWSLPAGASILSGSTSISLNANMSAVAAGTYTYGVAGVNVCGSGTLSTASITVNALPSVTVNSGAVCSGSSFVIIPSGASTYSVTGNIFTVSPVSNTNYTVTGFSAFGCVSSNAPVSTVVVNALPLVTVNNGSICSGNSFVITPSLAPTASLSYTVTGNLFVVSPGSNTSYSVTGTDVNGCVSSNTAVCSVVVYSLPVISVGNGTLCTGNSVAISPSGAGSSGTYTFGGISGAGPFVVSPAVTTNYTVAGTNSLGCVSSNTPVSAVTVYSLPIISVNSPTMCLGQSATIIPSGSGTSGTYTVGGVGGAGPFIVSPAITTNYTVAGTNSLGCVSSNTPVSAVSVFTLPVISVNSGTICLGQSHVFIPNGASTYSIQGNSFTVSPLSNSSYTVNGTSAAGCVSSFPATGNVTVFSLPVVSVNSGTVCLGRTFTLVPSGAGTGATYSVAIINTTLVSPTINSTYSITGTNSLGCISSNTAIASVSVIALPVISSTNGAICLGGLFTTTVTGASTYTYTGPSSVISSTGSVSLIPATTTVYSITGTSPVGCISASPFLLTVTVNPLPPVAINGPTAVCDGISTTLTAVGANVYNWGTSTNSFLVITPSVSTTYSVLGTDLNNCSFLTSFFLLVNPLPTITVISGAICPGNCFTLTPGGASSYTYANGSSVVCPSVTSNYSVTGTSTAGCLSLLPAVGTVSVVNILTVTVSGNTTICLGGSINLTANGASTYSWNNGALTNTISASPTANTSYTVVGSSGTCNDTAFVSVVVNALPNVTASASTSFICVGETGTLTASGASTYAWNTAQTGTSAIVSPTVTTNYTVTGTDGNNCVNTATVSQVVSTCVGLSSHESNGWSYSVYPNPNTGEFVIETQLALQVTITNALGQSILKQQLYEGKNTIDLNEQAKGIYFIQIKNGNVTKTVKVIKQ